MASPDWLLEIQWSTPVPIEVLRLERKRIPRGPGLYVFTAFDGPIVDQFGVLYVGMAKSIYRRVSIYLRDPSEVLLLSPKNRNKPFNSALRHAGKVQLLIEVQAKYRELGHSESSIWIRWYEHPAPKNLENKLIRELRPAFNTQDKPEPWN